MPIKKQPIQRWRQRLFGKLSFTQKLMLLFLFLSLVPVTAVQVIHYYNTVTVMERKIKEYARISLVQTVRNIRTELSSYEDLLYQVAYDDSFIELLDRLNDSHDALARNQLQLKLNILSYSKKWIGSLLAITDTGDYVISIDRTGQDLNLRYWQSQGDLTRTPLYRKSIELYGSNVWEGTRRLGGSADHPYDSFFLSRRIIDFNTNTPLGVAILSINEPLLAETYQDQKRALRQGIDQTFVVDGAGTIISHPLKPLIGRNLRAILPARAAGALLRGPDQEVAELNAKIDKKEVIVYSAPIPKTGWRVVNIIDRSYLLREIYFSKNLMLLVETIAALLLLGIAIGASNKLTGAVKQIVQAMLRAQNGDLTARVAVHQTHDEFATIARSFNSMMEKLGALVAEVKRVTQKEKEAELKTLEMQINPHFLYNTLDSINWMAIEKGEYEISESLKQLATILRYSISNSNQLVTVGQEMEWLQNYLALQQYRFSDKFSYQIAIEPELREVWIHKLLFQPFIENAIIHGLAERKRGGLLTITGRSLDERRMLFVIRDNGQGMSRAKLRQVFEKREAGQAGIGVINALTRLELYYGADYRLDVHSEVGAGTAIELVIPKDGKVGEDDANCGG